MKLPAKKLPIVLLILGVITRVVLHFVSHPFVDDAFIGFRYSQNFAAGKGLVYIAGEHVFGTSAPFFALFLGCSARLLPFISIPTLSIVIGIAAFIVGFIALLDLLAQSQLPEVPTNITLILFSLLPYLVQTAVGGMETSFVLMLMLLALQFGFRRQYGAAGVFCALLLATRVDGIAWVSILFLALLIRERRLPLPAVLGFVMPLLAWIAFAWHEWGSLVPVTTKVKLAVFSTDSSFMSRLVAIVLGAWPHPFHANTLALLLVFIGLFSAYKLHWRLSLVFFLFTVGYCISFAVPNTMVFVWYMAPPIMAICVLQALGIAQLIKPIPRAAPIVCSLLVLSLLTWNVRSYRDYWKPMSERANQRVGEFLSKDTSNPVVFAEPAGYIGYYCNCTFRDSVGLVYPQLIDYWRRPGGRPAWFFTAFRDLHPDYIVLRTTEVTENRLFPTKNSPLFKTTEEREWFESSYKLVFSADPPNEKGKGFLVFHRQD